jgi:hypothetical protein
VPRIPAFVSAARQTAFDPHNAATANPPPEEEQGPPEI